MPFYTSRNSFKIRTHSTHKRSLPRSLEFGIARSKKNFRLTGKRKNVEIIFIFDLMLAANEFELAGLSNKLEIILIEDKASWLKTHFTLVYNTIFGKENFCNDIVVKYPNLIFDSSDFQYFSSQTR
ncbi:hypothetical protein Glove_109g267 [Diversispora epigaea]|uniref:BACK domain-containing protein n=1 Tax=Diversispora epigaea TaxID=1348612 RepID=A0A397JBQ6_9GLOM|nr:hypothetical protein Glove_109g267 [Diversispora epigaea]